MLSETGAKAVGWKVEWCRCSDSFRDRGIIQVSSAIYQLGQKRSVKLKTSVQRLPHQARHDGLRPPPVELPGGAALVGRHAVLDPLEGVGAALALSELGRDVGRGGVDADPVLQHLPHVARVPVDHAHVPLQRGRRRFLRRPPRRHADAHPQGRRRGARVRRREARLRGERRRHGLAAPVGHAPQRRR